MKEIKATEKQDSIEISNGKILCKFYTTKGTYDIIDLTANITKIADISFEICFELNDKIQKFSSRGITQWTWEINEWNDKLGQGSVLNLSHQDTIFQSTFKIILYPHSEHIFLQLSLVITTPAPIKLIELKPFVFCNGRLPLEASSNLRILKNDWQSWSPIELVNLNYKEPRANVKVERRSKHSREIKPKKGDIWSDYFSVLINSQTKEQLFLGFITLADQFSLIQWKIKGKEIIERIDVSCLGDSILLEKGDQLKSEILMVSFKTGAAILEEWARITGTLMKKRDFTSIPVGWCSWYNYYRNIDEGKVLSNVEALHDMRETIPVEFIQIDDGYELALGNWLEVIPQKFPKGLKYLVQQIKAAGFKAGIWLAPFLVSTNSQVYTSHKDWFIRDKTGNLIWGAWPFLGASSFMRAIFRDRVAALDCTNPEVQVWLKNLIKALVEDIGFDYLKIDFIYGAAMEGVRYNKKMTRAQAYRTGLEMIRQAAGEKTFILGCGAPFGPSIGVVDAMRVSTDTAPSFGVPSLLKLINKLLFANLETIPSIVSATQQNMLRYFFHRHFWINDPDCLIVRRASKLSGDEIKFEVTAIGLLGGLLFLGDNIAKLAPDEIELIRLLIPPYGISAKPLDLFEKNYPEILMLDVETTFDNWNVIGIFNWSNQSKAFNLDLNQIFSSNQKSYHIFEFWNREYLGIHKNTFQIDSINPHSAKLLAIHEVKDSPTLISSTFHLTQGAIEVKQFTFDPITPSLHIFLEKRGKNKGSIFLYVPNELLNKEIGIEGDCKDFRRKDNLLTLDLEFSEKIELTLKFK